MSTPNVTPQQWKSLDLECAVWAERTAGPLSNKAGAVVNDAASVLAKQGPYAMMVFLESKGKPDSNHLLGEIVKALNDIASLKAADQDQQARNGGKVRATLKQASQNIDDLLLARTVLQQCLVYLRSQVKAKP